MDDYDSAARYAAKIDAAGFFRWLLGPAGARLHFRGWLDAHTLPAAGEGRRTADTVAHLRDPADPGHPVALVTEFQTRADAEILERLLEYAARLRRELRRRHFRVVPAVVHLTGLVQPTVLEMLLPGRGGFGIIMRPAARALGVEDAGATLAAIAAGAYSRCILPWVPLMRGADDAAIIAEWQRLAAAGPGAGRKAEYGLLALMFAGLTRRRTAWRFLEGWGVYESPVANKLRAEGQREALLQALEVRFQSVVPNDLAAALNASTDPSELRHWLREALTAATLADFRAAIGR